MDYTALAATAARLIASAGQTAILTRTTRGAYDPNLGRPVDGAVTTAECTVVVQNFKLRDIDGTRIKSGDLEALVGPDVSLVPQPGDALTVDGVSYTVIEPTIVKPGPVTLYYSLHVRRS